MYISKFRLKNYKSYLDSGEVNLGPGINIITGQNNAGKTALLQALTLAFEQKQHRSSKTITRIGATNNHPCLLEAEVTIPKNEFEYILFNNYSEIRLPKPDGANYNIYNDRGLFDVILKEDPLLSFTKSSNNSILKASLKGFREANASFDCFIYRLNHEAKSLHYTGNQITEPYFYTLTTKISEYIYCFQAERMNVGICNFGTNSILKPNASNLPEVLENLRGDIFRFERYNKLIRKIFPQIYWVDVRPRSNNQIEIVTWNEDPANERSDLVVPLLESGTGLSQVLAILYVVLTSHDPRIILIDEPNSFLHPGAARKLIEILKEYPQHQFIISTHSPSTIAAANPNTINIIKTENAESKIEPINVSETNQHQLYLAEIGVKLADVFGADNILWVEGKTEEICFPKIIEATDGISLMGTSILGVKSTGELQTKDSKRVFEIYDKLSKGKGLMPPAVGFIFDKEEHSEGEILDLKKRSNNKVEFTERMMYENYLLNPEAIFNVLNSISEISDIGITQEQVNEWIEKNKWEKEYIKTADAKIKSEEIWIQKVNAAKFLSTLFSELTSNRILYSKTTHSVALTEWIIQNSISDFLEIQNLLHSFLKEN